MDANEVEFELDEVSPEDTRPGLLQSSWRGAVAGFKFVSYVIGPISALLLGLGLVATVLGLEPGGVWNVLRIVFGTIGGCVVSALSGGVIGAVVGLIGGVIVRIWPGASRLSSLSGAMHRPIRLFGKGREKVVPVASAPSRFRVWHWVVIVPTLVMLVAAIGTGIYLWWIVEGQFAEVTVAADRDDPYWRLDDLMAHREPVPDEENSAPVVAEVLKRMPEGWPAAPKGPPGTPPPPPTEVSKALERMHDRAENVRLDDATAEVLRVELEALDEAVQIARIVADDPRGRHELELGPTLLDASLTETQEARTVGRLLAADVAIRAHDGDLDGALDSCRAILGTTRSIGDEPFAISQLVRIAIGAMGMRSARLAMAQGEPSDAALARLQSLILDELAQPLLLHAMRGERAMLTELIRRVGAGEMPTSALGDVGSSTGQFVSLAGRGPWGGLWCDYQRAIALEWMNGAVAIARRPAAERPALWEAWQARIDQTRRSRVGLFIATLPILLMPAMATEGSSHSRYHCELGATAILLAAERHRRKSGDWPASIAAIDRDILPDAPVNPFSGGAFRMERRDGQLRVYSIGPNRKDEHGEYEPKRSMKGGPDDAGAVGWDVPLRRQSGRSSEEPGRSGSSP